MVGPLMGRRLLSGHRKMKLGPLRRLGCPKEGRRYALELYVTTHFAPLWHAIARVPSLRRGANRRVINLLISKMGTRPAALSTLAPYTSWNSLTDRTYSDRHLPPGLLPPDRLPPVDEVAALF